ncbi:hypothetical protein GGI07_003268 [Coemansia sp. Benny D115]|nr:hypothetical protein GGI07_003268 [Coemansia sp. Benny D115]
MDQHPQYPEVAAICTAHPRRARALFQTYLHVKNVHGMHGANACVLGDLGIPAVVAQNRPPDSEEAAATMVFVPVNTSEQLSMATLARIRDNAAEIAARRDCECTVHLALVDNDSTIVFYKLGALQNAPDPAAAYMRTGDEDDEDSD